MSNKGIVSKIALPYAEALLEYAQYNKLINETNQDLSLISHMLLKSNDLNILLQNPLITADKKKKIFNQLLLNQVDNFVLKFLLVLIDRRRITLLNVIIEKYFELVNKLDSTIIAEILTPIAFNEIQQNALIDKLKGMTNSKQVKLVIKVDPSLIGGFIIQIGSKVIDTSLSGKLKQMAFYLNAN